MVKWQSLQSNPGLQHANPTLLSHTVPKEPFHGSFLHRWTAWKSWRGGGWRALLFVVFVLLSDELYSLEMAGDTSDIDPCSHHLTASPKPHQERKRSCFLGKTSLDHCSFLLVSLELFYFLLTYRRHLWHPWLITVPGTDHFSLKQFRNHSYLIWAWIKRLEDGFNLSS